MPSRNDERREDFDLPGDVWLLEVQRVNSASHTGNASPDLEFSSFSSYVPETPSSPPAVTVPGDDSATAKMNGSQFPIPQFTATFSGSRNEIADEYLEDLDIAMESRPSSNDPERVKRSAF